MPLWGKNNDANSAPKFVVNDKGVTGKTGFGTSVFLENGNWVYKYTMNGKIFTEVIASCGGSRLQTFRQALLNRSTTPLNIVAIGDSISEGYPPSGTPSALLTNQRWLKLFGDLIRSNYPTSGAQGTPGYYAAWRGNGAFPTDYPVTGQGAFNDGYGIGLRSRLLTSGQVMSFVVPNPSTSIDIFYGQGFGIFNYQINGGTSIPVNTAGVDDDFKSTRISNLSGGETITITASSNVVIDGFYAYRGDENKGIRLWDAARASILAFSLNAEDTPTNVRWFNAFSVLKPQLVTLEVGANDWLYLTPTQFQNSVNGIISKMTAKIGQPFSLIIMSTWQVGDPQLGYTWDSYRQVLKNIANTRGNDTVFWDMRNAINKPDESSNNMGGLLPDTIHPGVQGSISIANSLYPVILS